MFGREKEKGGQTPLGGGILRLRIVHHHSSLPPLYRLQVYDYIPTMSRKKDYQAIGAMAAVCSAALVAAARALPQGAGLSYRDDPATGKNSWWGGVAPNSSNQNRGGGTPIIMGR